MQSILVQHHGFGQLTVRLAVLAACIAVLVSIHATISTTLWCGAACYLLLLPIAINLARLRHNEPEVIAVPAASG